jgi:hypothetical protein
LLLILFSACKDDDKTHQLEITKALKERELVFNTLNKTWNFTPKRLSPESEAIESNWNEWRLFVSELDQKPKGTIGAFQRKTKMLVQKATLLESTIPSRIDKPQIKSRLSAMITKVKALHTFLNLDRIPEKKVVELITDLNIEVIAIQDQIDEIVRRSHIQKEEGEQEMLNSINGGQSMSETVKPEEAPKEIEEQGILK